MHAVVQRSIVVIMLLHRGHGRQKMFYRGQSNAITDRQPGNMKDARVRVDVCGLCNFLAERRRNSRSSASIDSI